MCYIDEGGGGAKALQDFVRKGPGIVVNAQGASFFALFHLHNRTASGGGVTRIITVFRYMEDNVLRVVTATDKSN